jgi:ribosomal protein L11 methyltransferase
VLWELGTAGTHSVGTEGGRTVVLAYFAGEARLDDLREALSPWHAGVAPAEVPEVDWVARVRDGFRAFALGAFRIVPAWDAPAGAPVAGTHTLVVEPGVAFGTGSHESTRLCLRILEERSAGASLGAVADIGTGSGILAVAACRLGARRVVALEIDDEALPVAARHAALNAVPVHLVRGDGARPLRARAFDLLLANISAALLTSRAEELAGAVRGGGWVVLSGLLTDDVAEVRAAWEPLAREIDVRTEGAWAALLIRTRT